MRAPLNARCHTCVRTPAFSRVIAGRHPRPIVRRPRRSDDLNMASPAATDGRNTCLETEESGFDLGDEIVRRASAIADGTASSGTSRPICRTLGQRLDERERRARRLASATSALAPAAALEFVGAAIAAATVEGLWVEGAAQTVVAQVAAQLDAAEHDASLVVFRSAISSR